MNPVSDGLGSRNVDEHLVVDGLIFSVLRHGGILRLFSEALPRVCELEPGLQVTLLATGERGNLPSHPRIAVRRLVPVEGILRPGRLWLQAVPKLRQWVQRVALRNEPRGIWHSTYSTLLPGWRGPTAVTVYDLIGEHFKSLLHGAALRATEQFNGMQRRAVQAADVVLCISEATRADAVRTYGIPPERTRVVPLACNECFAPEQVRSPSGRPFVLYVGSRYGYKNFRTLLRAFASWGPGHGVGLVVVGRAWSLQERREVAALGIGDWVRVVEMCSDAELCGLYNAAGAFVYPSLCEGFGIPLLEAMACGCPVVASRIPSTVEVSGECPFYFEPESVEDLVRALSEALAAGRSGERAERGFRRAREFSWDRTAEMTLAVYRELWARERETRRVEPEGGR
ncbi:MAG: glycosyltransferase family 1 protein [Actinomycetota bacterium]|nr:glycosyltransferase family 1 protein [Actinomycetota bacterium]